MYVLVRVHVAVTADAIGGLMSKCESSRNVDPNDPFNTNSDVCFCPADMIGYYGLTEAELTYCMEQEQPATWTDPGQYCGDASLSCDEPVCITLPR